MDDRALLADGTTGAAFALPPLSEGDAALVPSTRSELLAHLSAAFDLAEARTEGHAARVALLGLETARSLRLDRETRERIFYAALLHDAHLGVDPDEAQLEFAARAVFKLGLDLGVAQVIRVARELIEGDSEADSDTSIEALCVAAAHWACDVAEDENPLRARTRLQGASDAELAAVAGAEVATAIREALRNDETWIHFWDDELPSFAASQVVGERGPSVNDVIEAASAMGDLVDAALREPGRARRVADLASALAGQLALPESTQEALGVAGYLVDIGQLSVPREITEKPSILSVEEMEQMRRHPGLGARIVERIAGMGDIALWIEMHHERPDGRGYPEMLTNDELPLPPRILAVADSYWALRAERPYRPAMSVDEALEVIQSGAGAQYDQQVANALKAVVHDAEEGADAA
jgi:response regulator RpfG family c-di-GMP phosphodiesterase